MKMKSIFRSLLLETIDVSDLRKIGKVTDFTVKLWKKSPGDFTSACQAAGFYSRKYNEDMLVVPSNSYGAKIFHIIRKTDDLAKYVPGSTGRSVNCGLVNSSGEVFQGIAKVNKK